MLCCGFLPFTAKSLPYPQPATAFAQASRLPCARGAGTAIKNKNAVTEGLYPRPVIAFTPMAFGAFLGRQSVNFAYGSQEMRRKRFSLSGIHPPQPFCSFGAKIRLLLHRGAEKRTLLSDAARLLLLRTQKHALRFLHRACFILKIFISLYFR